MMNLDQLWQYLAHRDLLNTLDLVFVSLTPVSLKPRSLRKVSESKKPSQSQKSLDGLTKPHLCDWLPRWCCPMPSPTRLTPIVHRQFFLCFIQIIRSVVHTIHTTFVVHNWPKNWPTMVAGGFRPWHRLWASGAQTQHIANILTSGANVHMLGLGIIHVWVE